MANKKKSYCPIMTIGFNPPAKKEKDLRLCKPDCAWYDTAEGKCKIVTIAESLEYILSCVDSIPEGYYAEPFDNYEDT